MADKKDDEKQKTDLVWKGISAVTLLASGFVAEKVVDLGWKAVTGSKAPKEESELLTHSLAEVALFAVLSGAAMTLTRQLALRGVAQWYGGDERNPLGDKKLSA